MGELRRDVGEEEIDKLSNDKELKGQDESKEIDMVFSTTNTTISKDIAIDSPYSSENSSIDNSYSGDPTSIEADYEEIDGHKEVLSTESLEAPRGQPRGIRLTDVGRVMVISPYQCIPIIG